MPAPLINLDLLSEAELRDLNRRIVERLRVFHQLRAHGAMMQFSIGDRVEFDTDDGRRIVGTLTRYNRKSVTVIADGERGGVGGARWTVSPTFLRPAEPVTVRVVPNTAGLLGRGGAGQA